MSNKLGASLAKYLENNFGSDFVLESYDNYSVNGSLFGKNILFTLGDNAQLQISSSDSEFRFLNMIVPSLIVFMDGKSPISRYCVVVYDDYKINSFVIDWNSNVDNRLDELKNGGNLDSRHCIRRFRPLVETREERDKRLGFTTFSSLFFPDGNLIDIDCFSEMVKGYSEQDCFIVLSLLDGLQSQYWNRSWKVVSFDIISLCDAMSIVRKRVESFCNCDNNINNYDLWYAKWNEFFTYVKKCEYMEARLNGDDISSFVPTNSSLVKKKGWGLL